jgi:hypothetical protein
MGILYFGGMAKQDNSSIMMSIVVLTTISIYSLPKTEPGAFDTSLLVAPSQQ